MYEYLEKPLVWMEILKTDSSVKIVERIARWVVLCNGSRLPFSSFDLPFDHLDVYHVVDTCVAWPCMGSVPVGRSPWFFNNNSLCFSASNNIEGIAWYKGGAHYHMRKNNNCKTSYSKHVGREKNDSLGVLVLGGDPMCCPIVGATFKSQYFSHTMTDVSGVFSS